MTALEKKFIAGIMIALLSGLLIGVALNYVIYQPQLQNLQNSLNDLNVKVDEYAEYNSTLNELRSEISGLNAAIGELNVTTTSNSTADNETATPLPYERLQFMNLNAAKDDSTFTLYFNVTSTGTAPAVLESVYLNDNIFFSVAELTVFAINGTSLPNTEPLNPIILLQGDTASIMLTLTESDNFKTGTVVLVSVRTIVQNPYGATVTLP